MKKELNSFQLKCICIGFMIVGICLQQAVFLFNTEEQLPAGLALAYNFGYLLYLAAFPLAAFLLAEAARKNSDRKRLFKRILIAALIVEIPMDIATFGVSGWKNWGLSQNFFFTMCIGLAVLMAADAFGKKFKAGSMGYTLSTLVVYLAGAILAVFAKTELGSIGVLMIVTVHLFYGNKMFSFLSMAVLYIMFIKQFFPAFSILLTWFYNGKQGKNCKVSRSVFYFAFPVVYVVLGIAAQMMQ